MLPEQLSRLMTELIPISSLVRKSARSVVLILLGPILIWLWGHLLLDSFPDSLGFGVLLAAALGLTGVYIAPWFTALKVAIAIVIALGTFALLYIVTCPMGC
jgi:hypothetical protein